MKCKNCGQPIKKSPWSTVEWTHDVLMTDNQIECRSTTYAEPASPKKGAL